MLEQRRGHVGTCRRHSGGGEGTTDALAPEQTPCIQEAEGRLEEQKQSWGKETKRT